MENIINIIEEKYLIGDQNIKLLDNGNILFTEEDGTQYEQNKKEFINDYIDFLTDLLNQNKKDNYFKCCINILEDLKVLYDGLIILSVIK